MAANRIVVGDKPLLSKVFTTPTGVETPATLRDGQVVFVDGTPVDPTTVGLVVTKPDGTQTSYTHAGGTVSKFSTGVFDKQDLTVDQPGTWVLVWTGTGPGADVDVITFDVWAPTAPGDLDVVTFGEAKDALQIKGAKRDDRLKQMISGVSERLDQACGAIVQREVVDEFHDGGGPSIWLPHPVASFTSVVEYQGTTPVTLTLETPGTAPSEGYLARRHRPDPTLYSGVLVRRFGGYGGSFYPGVANVKVSYTAGRFATTADVSSLFKEAALEMLQNLMGSEAPTVEAAGEFDQATQRFPRFAIPNAVRQHLHAEWRETTGFS
jgi:hypothetical protein